MKDAPGKHGSAMPEKAAKKIQRRNGRRASKEELESQAKEAGLGVHQVMHFNHLTLQDLHAARFFSTKELGALRGLVGISASDLTAKIANHEAVIRYIDKLLKDRR